MSTAYCAASLSLGAMQVFQNPKSKIERQEWQRSSTVVKNVSRSQTALTFLLQYSNRM